MYVIPNSEAIYKPMIKAWYSATLFEHNSPSVKLYGNICFSGEMKTMLTPAPLLRVAPSKNMIQGSMLSTNNTSSSGKSSHNFQFDGIGCSAKKSANAWPFTAF